VSSLSPIKLALSKLGPLGTIDLVRRKYLKQARYKQMLREVPHSGAKAILKDRRGAENVPAFTDLDVADAMLRDENKFFTFDYKTKGIERPWNFDPLEKKYWPGRHYTEQYLHARDTPKDAKIVWEINRFKDLPALGQAALLTREKKYADEVERRLVSWIDENPFAGSINWASALEISIRLLSWTATLILLRDAGFSVHENAVIQRSIYEHARYLAGDLSTDKVIPSNHLIGEVAGLYVVSLLWDFPASQMYAQIAKRILEKEIVRQTYADGATRESSAWYHQFVTNFADLADRVAARSGQQLSSPFHERVSKMKAYLNAISVNGEVMRYGDADDGLAIYFEGDAERWKDYAFGPSTINAEASDGYFRVARHVAVASDNSFLFLRGGEFGMGGAGFSSHAHDDLLAPIIYIDGLAVLVDPGTFVYNGDPKNRAKYRDGWAHNNLIVGEGSAARQKMNFGWREVRPPASIPVFQQGEDKIVVAGQCSDWSRVMRQVELTKAAASVIDVVEDDLHQPCEWLFHLAPEWKRETQSGKTITFTHSSGARLLVTANDAFDTVATDTYDYSPSYRVEVRATLVRLTGSGKAGSHEVRFALER
jgi:hypothetical protein